jgi:adenosylhomocysteine nucleosidase
MRERRLPPPRVSRHTGAVPGARVALLAPMQPELRPLVRPLGLAPHPSGGGLYGGRLGAREVTAAVSGIGTAAAARAAERLLGEGRAEHLVVVGIAGGIGPSVAVGDLVVPERVLDLASGREYRPARLGGALPRGLLVTSDALVTDRGEIARLEARGAVAIDMETAAVAAVCEARGCPWSVFRGISDRADGGGADEAILGLAGPDGRGDLLAVARFVLTRPWRIPELVRLARGMGLATRRAADAALRAL